MTKLTQTQHEIMSLVADSTEFANGCTDNAVTRFFVPRERAAWSTSLERTVWIDGAGFAGCIRACIRKGWMKQETVSKYSVSITEEGLLQIELYREAIGFYARS